MLPSTESRRLLGIPTATLTWLFAVSVVCVLATPSLGLWLPWATEQDKVKQTLNEIYKALIANDRKMLDECLVGVGTAQFIEYEQSLIKRMKVKEYDCKPRSIQIDPGSGAWAFVDLEKIAKLENGDTFTQRSMVALKKVAGLWRLLIEPRRKDRKQKVPAQSDAPTVSKESSGTRESHVEPAGPAMSDLSSSGQEVK